MNIRDFLIFVFAVYEVVSPFKAWVCERIGRIKVFDEIWVAEQEAEVPYLVQGSLECLEGVNGEVSGYDGEDGTVFDFLF